MDYIVIGLLIVLTSLVSAVLYACCVMSGTKECKRRIRGTEKRKRIGKLLGEK